MPSHLIAKVFEPLVQRDIWESRGPQFKTLQAPPPIYESCTHVMQK